MVLVCVCVCMCVYVRAWVQVIMPLSYFALRYGLNVPVVNESHDPTRCLVHHTHLMFSSSTNHTTPPGTSTTIRTNALLVNESHEPTVPPRPYALDVLLRAEDGVAKRRALERGGVEVVEHELLRLVVHLLRREREGG